MTDRIILVCCALFLPLGLVIANSLISRTQIKQKERQIETLKNENSYLTAEKKVAEKSANIQQKVTQTIGNLVHATLKNSETFADLNEQAKHVQTEQDAIDLARRQVEANQ